MKIRHAHERGRSDNDWLNSAHTFSFADYYDKRWMGFRALRVINEDLIQPGTGFGMHTHKDMEIITYVITGELAHQDTMGNGSVIKPGDIQRMSAGAGIQHSEFNHATTEPLHLLQIWITPEKTGLTPSYEQKSIHKPTDALSLIAASQPKPHAVKIHQDCALYLGCLSKGASLSHLLNKPFCWIQLIRGTIQYKDYVMQAGDGLALEQVDELVISAQSHSEFLLFELI